MPSAFFQRLAEEAKALTPEEQQQMRALLERYLWEEVNRRLLAEGVISSIPPSPTEEDVARFRAYKPIVVQGKPLSESIIEDRR